MRFTIKREEFLKALNIATKAISSKIAVPVLENFKFELTDRGLFITGSNLDFTIKTQVPYKNGDEEIIRNYKEGSALIHAQKITEFIRKIESDEVSVDVIDSTIAEIHNNQSSMQLSCIRVEEYLDIDLEASGSKLTLSATDFNNIVNQTAYAASLNEQQKPSLTAINLEAYGNVLIATATDRTRLARKTINISNPVEFSANVPAKMMVEVSHLLEGKDSLDIAFSDKKALFTIGTTVVATRLIAEEYPKTKQIVPNDIRYTLEVNGNDLIKAIERASIISGKESVKLSMSEDGVTVSAKSSKGAANEKIDIFKYVGSNFEIKFAGDRIIAAIKALGCTDVTLEFVGEMKLFFVENALDDSVIQVVTPSRY